MAVLFDLDGTLLDTALDFVVAINNLCQQQNRPLVTYQEVWPLVSLGRKHIVEHIFQIDPQDTTRFANMVTLFVESYSATNHQATMPFPMVNDLLTKLEQANIIWGIVTNKPSNLTHQILKQNKLQHQPKCIVCGDTTPNAKPHPEPLLYASKLINTPAENCIYIGDAKHDIIAGNAAGMHTVTALYGYIADLTAALAWPANDKVNTVEQIFPLIYQWHKQKNLSN